MKTTHFLFPLILALMEDAFWESFDPSKSFSFRFMAKKPLKMNGGTLGQQPKSR